MSENIKVLIIENERSELHFDSWVKGKKVLVLKVALSARINVVGQLGSTIPLHAHQGLH